MMALISILNINKTFPCYFLFPSPKHPVARELPAVALEAEKYWATHLPPIITRHRQSVGKVGVTAVGGAHVPDWSLDPHPSGKINFFPVSYLPSEFQGLPGFHPSERLGGCKTNGYSLTDPHKARGTWEEPWSKVRWSRR